MKIVYCIAGTCHSGGMERVLANKANYLVRQGYEISVVTTDQWEAEPFFELDSRIKCYDLGINYEENNGRSIWNKLLHYPLKQYRHKRKLKTLLDELKPDITVSMFCNDVSFIADLKDGSKKVLEIHFSKFKRLQYERKGLWSVVDRYLTKRDEKLVKRFDKFIVLTEEDKGYWGNLENIMVIPNARTFNPDKVSDLTNKKAIAIGRLGYQKGFERLIEAWAIVAAKHGDWELEIVGNGEDKDKLQRQIDSLNLKDHVKLVTPSKDVEKLYLNSSMLVMSSRYEGLPMVLLEAQAYGLPIVSFKCKCGPTDVVSEGVDGFLVPEGDSLSLADRIIELIENHDLRIKMGIAAKNASERYEEGKIMAVWKELFENLCK